MTGEILSTSRAMRSDPEIRQLHRNTTKVLELKISFPAHLLEEYFALVR